MSGDPSTSLLSGERAPFAFLAIFLGCAGAFSLAFGIAEGIDTNAGKTGMVAFAGSLVLAGLTWWIAPRFGSRGFAWATLATALVIALSATQAQDRNDQLSAALVLLMLGVMTAFFVPVPRMWGILAVQMALFAVAMLVDVHHVSLWSYVVLGGTNVVLAYAVSTLAARMRAEADHDPLTEVLNRHGFEEQAHIVEALARRAGDRVFVGYVDLDAFKRYNDVHGHGAGDQLLTDVAHAWSAVLRAGDLLVRWGGDEFLVVLPAGSMDDAEVAIARMRGAHPTAWTCGLTEWNDGEDLDAVIERADGALLSAKAQRVPGAVGHSARGPWPSHWSEMARTRAALAAQLDPQILVEPVHTPDGEVVDFRVVDANPAACAFRGIPLEDAVGGRVRDRVPGEPREWLFAQLVRTLDTGVPLVLDGYEHRDPDGSRHVFDLRAGRYEEALSLTWREVTHRFDDAAPPTDARSARG